jgi:hypothetical protein
MGPRKDPGFSSAKLPAADSSRVLGSTEYEQQRIPCTHERTLAVVQEIHCNANMIRSRDLQETNITPGYRSHSSARCGRAQVHYACDEHSGD